MHESFSQNPAEYGTWMRALWATAHAYGLDEEAVRDIAASVSGARSISGMTRDQFRAWFKRVDELYGKGKKKKKRSNHGESRRKKKMDSRVRGNDREGASRSAPTYSSSSENIIEIATPEQLALIRHFARETLGWKRGWNEQATECESISKIISKHTRGRKSEIRLLTKYEARALIETLKKIWERKKGPGAA